MTKYIKLLSFMLCAIVLASCEKASLEDLLGKKPPVTTEEAATLTVHIGGIADVNYREASAKGTRAAQPIASVCSKLTIALYNEDGTRVYCANKKSTDADFADMTMKLAEGNYSLVVIAHSNEKNATTTSISKITFDGKVSDTFHYYRLIDIKKGANSMDIILDRVTAMFRLEIADEIPDNVKQLKFYYTGGSSTLDGTTGAGCVNSRQTELRTVTPGVNIYDVYTFPQSDDKKLKMTVTALDASGSSLCEKTFENVAVSRNVITHYKGSLFGNVVTPSATDDYAFSISANTDWLGENVIEF